MAQTYIDFVTSILGGAITLSSAQWLFSVLRFRFDILLGWRRIKSRIVVLALAARLFAGIGLIFSLKVQPAVIALLVIVLVANLFLYRLMSPHFTAVFRMTHLLAGVLLFAHGSNPELKVLSLAMIAGLCMMSYMVSGVTKLIQPGWRNGDTLGIFLGSRVNGSACRFYQWLDRNPRWRMALSVSVILFEVFSPFLVLAGPEGAMLFFVLAGSFHLGIAVAMGMNLFPLTWISTYPAVYYCSTNLENVFRFPDRLTPLISILMIWFAAVVALQCVAWIPWIRKRRRFTFYLQLFEFYLYVKPFPNPGIRYRADNTVWDAENSGVWKDLPFYCDRRLIHSLWHPEHDLKNAIRQVAFRMRSPHSCGDQPAQNLTRWIQIMEQDGGSNTFEYHVVDEESFTTEMKSSGNTFVKTF
jgi:hypothetical protein